MLEEAWYQFARWKTWLTSKGAVWGVATAMGGAAKIPIIGPATAIAGAGINIWTAQKDYHHENQKLLLNYGKYIAAERGMPDQILDEGDLAAVASYNPTFEEAMARNNKKRWIDIGSAVGSAIVGFAVLSAVALSATPAFLVAAGAAIVASRVINYTAKKALGFDKTTVHEDILKLQERQGKGFAITREQVFGLTLKANPGLASMVKEQVGVPFDKLPRSKQVDVAQSFGEMMNLDSIVTLLNNRQMGVQELAFTVHGQQSKVPPLPEPPKSRLEFIASTVSAQVETARALASAKAHTMLESARSSKWGSALANNRLVSRGHGETEPMASGESFVEKVTKSRAATPDMAFQRR